MFFDYFDGGGNLKFNRVAPDVFYEVTFIRHLCAYLIQILTIKTLIDSIEFMCCL